MLKTTLYTKNPPKNPVKKKIQSVVKISFQQGVENDVEN